MPATKKRKTAARSVVKMEKEVKVMGDHMNMLLVVFSIAMMMFAFVLFKVYA